MIESQVNRIAYSGNGVTTVFSVPFKFLTNADLKVAEVDSITKAITPKTLDTHYTLSGAGQATGSLTMLVAPASDKKLVVYYLPLVEQTLDLNDNVATPAAEYEKAYDRLALFARRCFEALLRTMKLHDAFYGSFDPTLPMDIDAIAGAVVVVNDTRTGFKMGPTVGEIAGAADAANAAIAAEAAAALAQAASAASAVSAGEAQTAAEEAKEAAAESANSAAAFANLVLGSGAAPKTVTTANGFVTGDGTMDASAGNVTLFCNGQNEGMNEINSIEASGVLGARLTIILKSATHFIKLVSGPGLELTGPWEALSKNDSIELVHDGSVWSDVRRNN